MEKRARLALLLDFYGDLLTPRQKELLKLYYEEDLSLGEIAENYRISRQAVFDQIHRGEKTLEKYEEKLGLVARFLEEARSWGGLLQELAALATELETATNPNCREVRRRLLELRRQYEKFLPERFGDEELRRKD